MGKSHVFFFAILTFGWQLLSTLPTNAAPKGGGGSGTPPANLNYSQNPAVYTVAIAIQSNVPSTTGGVPSSFSISPKLSSGLTLNSKTGIISGTPSIAKALTIYKVTAKNSFGSSLVSLSITVNTVAPPPPPPPPPAPTALMYSQNPAGYIKGVAITANQPSNSGGAIISYSVNPSLPAGLSLSTSTGVISGTPSVTLSQTNFVVTGANAGGSTTVNLSITVSNPPPSSGSGPERAIPSIALDDEGHHTSSRGCIGGGGTKGTCSVKTYAARPSNTCGNSGALSDRIADCASKNSARATFDASINGVQAGGVWKLVTVLNGRELWQDTRTGLVWSDDVGDSSQARNRGLFNWCLASGNTQDSVLGLNCVPTLEDSFNKSGSTLCAGVSPDGIHDNDNEMNVATWANIGTSVRDAKGAALFPAMQWRLPAAADWQQAHRNGVKFVLPRMGKWFWSATLSSSDRRNAWMVNGNTGATGEMQRSEAQGVRCVGVMP